MNGDRAQERWQTYMGTGVPAAAGTPEPAMASHAPRSLQTNPATGKKTVLLVDSNAQSRQMRAKIMRKLGVHVDTAAHPAGARARLASATYDLVLLDLGSDLDGAEALQREIKSKSSRQLVGFLIGSPLFVSTTLRKEPVAPPAQPETAAIGVAAQSTAAADSSDFGQKISKAEAEQSA